MSDIERRIEAAGMGLGPTGQFPFGKSNEADEGELKTAIYADKGQVVLNFGKQVAWLSLSPQGAADLANLLIQYAKKAAKQSNTTFSFPLKDLFEL